MQAFSLTPPEPTLERVQLPQALKDQAVLLHRANWGGALKISKLCATCEITHFSKTNTYS